MASKGQLSLRERAALLAGKRGRNAKAQLPTEVKIASKKKLKSKVNLPEWMKAEAEAAKDLEAALKIQKQIKATGRDPSDMPSYSWSEKQRPSDHTSAEWQLLNAAEEGDDKLASQLLKRKADPNAVDSARGYSALVWGAMSGDIDVVKVLIKSKADVNKATPIGQTPLMYAAVVGNLQMVDYLIKKGADCNAENHAGMHPTKFALENGFREVAERIQKGETQQEEDMAEAEEEQATSSEDPSKIASPTPPSTDRISEKPKFRSSKIVMPEKSKNSKIVVPSKTKERGKSKAGLATPGNALKNKVSPARGSSRRGASTSTNGRPSPRARQPNRSPRSTVSPAYRVGNKAGTARKKSPSSARTPSPRGVRSSSSNRSRLAAPPSSRSPHKPRQHKSAPQKEVPPQKPSSSPRKPISNMLSQGQKSSSGQKAAAATSSRQTNNQVVKETENLNLPQLAPAPQADPSSWEAIPVATLPDRIALLETTFAGEVKTGSLVDRLKALELSVMGDKASDGPLVGRVVTLEKML